MSKRVLIVEDERIVAEDIAQCLEESGYDVVGIANDSERALGLADEHRPDLILMDIVIQGERDGVDTVNAGPNPVRPPGENRYGLEKP